MLTTAHRRTKHKHSETHTALVIRGKRPRYIYKKEQDSPPYHAQTLGIRTTRMTPEKVPAKMHKEQKTVSNHSLDSPARGGRDVGDRKRSGSGDVKIQPSWRQQLRSMLETCCGSRTQAGVNGEG